ncbi:hypothetical protein IFM61606_10607, partial [Aspergillus udagawae]
REMGKDLTVELLPPEPHETNNIVEADSKDVSEEEQRREARRYGRTLQIDSEIKQLRLPGTQVKGFNYLLWSPRYLFEKPFHSRLPLLDCLKRNNVQSKAYVVTIHDLSGCEDQFNLATSGFHFLRCPIDMEDWTDKCIRDKYLPSMQDWLQKYFSCEQAHVYTYNVILQSVITHSSLTADIEMQVRSKDAKGNLTTSWVPTVPFAHCDVTPNAISTHLKLYLPVKTDEIMKKRHRFVNIWRTLTGPYQDTPLAVCDYRSVDSSDLVASDAVLAHYCGEAYDVKHSPHHRWVYKRGMDIEDVILFKLFDSDSSEANR